MSAIDEGIVREYFEQSGFLVRQVRKYQVQARRKTGDEEVDLVVYNPSYSARNARKPDFFLFANELAYVHRGKPVCRFVRADCVDELRKRLRVYKTFRALMDRWIEASIQKGVADFFSPVPKKNAVRKAQLK